MKLLIYCLINIFAIAKALNPGGQIHITQTGIDRAVHSMLQQALIKHDSFNLPDMQEGRVKLFDLNANVKLEPRNARIQLLDNGDISIQVHSVELEGTGKGRYQWGFVKKGANLRVKSEHTYLEIVISIVSENGRPRIVNKKTHFDIGQLHLYASGGILERLIEKILDAFKGHIKRRINDRVVKHLNDKLQEFSDRLLKIDVEKPLGGRFGGAFIDCGLTSNPIVSNSVLTIPIATQFWYNGHKNEAPIQSSGPYPFGSPWQMVCVDLGMFFINWIFVAECKG